jgi:hypothetical protein
MPSPRSLTLALIATGVMLAGCGGGKDETRVCSHSRAGTPHGNALVLTGSLTHAGGRLTRTTLCRTLGEPDTVDDVAGGQRWTYSRRGEHGAFTVGDDGRVSGSGARFTPRSGG